jgi:DHA1 family bicyclomycin/chloramphenicol resistance-like MFS transporter
MLSSEKTPKMRTILSALILASTAAMMSTHMYTPSMPHLVDYFQTTPAVVKLSLSLNALAFAMMQLIYGPLSDRFGRRPIMLFGMAGFTVFSLFCAVAQSIEQLILARVLLGIAAAGEAVLVYAIIHDLFDETGRVRALAIYGMVIALTPAVAPVVGGYVHVWLGWQANFIVIAVAGMLALMLCWGLLPESAVPDKNSLQPMVILKDYAKLLGNRVFMNYAVMTGAGSGVIMAFVTAGPFIMISYFNVATEHYGLYFVIPVFSFITANLVTRRMAGWMNIETLLRLGLIISATGVIAITGLIFSRFQGPLSLILVFSVTTFGLGPVFAIAPMRALDSTNSPTGVASALANMIPMLMGGLASVSLSMFHDGTSRPLAMTAIGLVCVAGVAYWLASGRTAHTKAIN